MTNFSLAKIDNRLQLLRVPMPSVESVTVLVLCNTGSRYETDKQHGIAHFFEHMVFKGTDKYPNAQVLSEAIESVGADFNAFTSKEYTGYYVKAAAQHIDLALDVVSDMMLTPRLRQEDIDREKGVIIEEINMYADTPARHVGDLFDRMAFSSGSGLNHDIIGDKDSVNSFKSKDFQDFLSQWYGQENMLLIVAGKAELVESRDLLYKVEEFFSKKTATKRQDGKAKVREGLKSKPLSDRKFHLDYKQTEQAHFILGWPGLDRHDERRFALSLLSTVMGGGMSSRLFSELREKRGLCYYVRSDVDQYHDVGFFGASAGVDPKRIDEALEVAVGQFENLVAGNPVTEAELKKAKDFTAGKMALSLEDSESRAHFYGMQQLMRDEVLEPEEIIERTSKVTLDEVMDLAKEIVTEGQIRFCLIGPFKDEDRFRKILEKW
jgi:predicted Zn-dependent peptidase